MSERDIPYGPLPDWALESYVKIVPWEPGQKRPGSISFGCGSMGYDIRLGRRFKVFTPTHCVVVDPKAMDPRAFVDVEGDTVLIPPNSYLLGESVEYFEVPDDVIGIAIGKSTYARVGIVANITPLEPGWKGRLTIEVSNSSPLPARLYAGEGICQVVFFRGAPPDRTYTQKGAGKYQNQDGLTLPKVD